MTTSTCRFFFRWRGDVMELAHASQFASQHVATVDGCVVQGFRHFVVSCKHRLFSARDWLEQIDKTR